MKFERENVLQQKLGDSFQTFPQLSPCLVLMDGPSLELQVLLGERGVPANRGSWSRAGRTHFLLYLEAGGSFVPLQCMERIPEVLCHPRHACIPLRLSQASSKEGCGLQNPRQKCSSLSCQRCPAEHSSAPSLGEAAQLCHLLFVISGNNEFKASTRTGAYYSSGLLYSQLKLLSLCHSSLTSVMFRSQRCVHLCRQV